MMNTFWAVVTSKTFWAGVGLFGLAIYQATQSQYDNAVQSAMAALAVLGIRHAIAKATNGDGK